MEYDYVKIKTSFSKHFYIR